MSQVKMALAPFRAFLDYKLRMRNFVLRTFENSDRTMINQVYVYMGFIIHLSITWAEPCKYTHWLHSKGKADQPASNFPYFASSVLSLLSICPPALEILPSFVV